MRSAVDAPGWYVGWYDGRCVGEAEGAARSVAGRATLPGSARLMRNTVGQRPPRWAPTGPRIEW
ncbi:Uncharacterised protein [Mycobacteroides abscessus]|nr:Uncharacterised protein [Mycobacteroides abscessus]